MATGDELVSILVGPTCPTCASDDLRWRAPLGALWWGQCRDCGTEYRWYGLPSTEADPANEATCPACGCSHRESDNGSPFCEDCEPSDCAYCGITTNRSMLSENRACQTCEQGEVA